MEATLSCFTSLGLFAILLQLDLARAATFSITSIRCTAKENSINVQWDAKPSVKQFNFSANPPINKGGKAYPIYGYIVSWFNVRYAVVTDNSAEIFKNILDGTDPMIRGIGVQHVLWGVYGKSKNDLAAVRSASEYLSSFEYRGLRPFGDRYKLTNLPYGDEYFFEVRGLVSEFAKDVKVIKLNASCSVTTEEGVPDKPGNFQVTPKNKRDITVSWTKPPKTKGQLTGYIIEYQMLGARKLEKVEATARTRNVIISGLEPYRVYNFRMAARNSKHTGTYTPWKKLRLQSREFFVKLRFPPHFHKQNPNAPKFEDEEQFQTFLESSLKTTLSGTSYRFLGFQNSSTAYVTLNVPTKREFEVVGRLYFGKNGLAQVNSLKAYLKNAFTSPPLSPARLYAFKDINFCQNLKTRMCHAQASCKSEHGIFLCKCKDNMIDDGRRSNKLPGIDCIPNTEAPIDLMAKAMNPSSIYLAWAKPLSAVGEIQRYDIQIKTLIDGKTKEIAAQANPGGVFTEYEFHNLPRFGLHEIRVRAVTDMAQGKWSNWITMRSETNIFDIVFDFTSTEPVTNYQVMRSKVHEDVRNAVVEAMRYNTAIDFRDYTILNSDVAGQNIVRVTAALFLGKDWNDGAVLIETTIKDEFKESVQIPSGVIVKESIKVSDFNECGTEYQDCEGNICKNTLGSFKCHCPHGHVDVSGDLGRLPGRKCIIFDAPGSFLVSVLDPKRVRVSFTIPHLLRNELYKFWFVVQFKRKGQDKIRETKVEVAVGNFTEDGYVVTKEIGGLRTNTVFLFRASAANKIAIGRFSTWVEAKISAHIYEARLNLTQLLYKNVFKFPRSKAHMQTSEGIRKFLNGIMGPRMSQYKNSGEIKLVPGIKGRTFAIIQMFFDSSSYVDPKQVSDMFKYNDITDNPFGLDFTTVELRDFDECNSTWSDCSLDGNCTNTAPGYTCSCREGYIDRGIAVGLLPGRICISPHATTTTKATITTESSKVPEAKHNADIQKPDSPVTQTTSTTKITTTSKAPLPTPGVELQALAISRSKLKTTWRRYNQNTPNLNDLTYIIQYTIKGLDIWKEVMVSASIPSLTITDLTPHLIYRLRVAEKWRTNSERHTKFSYPIEVRTDTKTYQFFTRLPNVLPDDLSNPRSMLYSEMQDYVTDIISQVYMSSYLKNHYRQIDFGDAGYVTFRPHANRGTEAMLLVFLTVKSAGGARLLRSAYNDAAKKISNPREMQLMTVTDFDECKVQDFMDCDPNANCHNADGTFNCICRPGFTDTSTTYNLLRGRKCVGKDTTTLRTTTTTMRNTVYGNDDGRQGMVISDLSMTNPDVSVPQQITSTIPPTTTDPFIFSPVTRFRIPSVDTFTKYKFSRPTTRPGQNFGFTTSTPSVQLRQYIFPYTAPSFNIPRIGQRNNFGGGRSSFRPIGPTVIPCNRGLTFIDGICEPADKYQGEVIIKQVNGKEASYEETKRLPLNVPVEAALDHIFRSSGMEAYKGVQFIRFERYRSAQQTGVKVVFVINMEISLASVPTAQRQKRQLFAPRQKVQSQKRPWEAVGSFFMKSLTTTGTTGIISTAKGKVQFDTSQKSTKFSDFNECIDVEVNTDCQPIRSECVNTPGSYTCRCTANFADNNPDHPGRQCVDQCEKHICENGGRCTPRIGMTPRCNCVDGYKGDRCEIENSGPNITLIGVAVGVIGFVICIMAATCAIIWIRKKASKSNTNKEQEDVGDNSIKSSDDDSSSLGEATSVKKTNRRAYLQPDVLKTSQPSRNVDDLQPANMTQSSGQESVESGTHIAPARPPKPLHYCKEEHRSSMESLPPKVPPRRPSLLDDDINCESDMPPTPPPKSKHMMFETVMRHEDLHSRPPAPPPRGRPDPNQGSNTQLNASGSRHSACEKDLPPRLPPKPLNLA